MRFKAIASSSHGNLYVVSDEKTTILLECGLSRRKTLKALDADMLGVQGILVTHCHKDHAACAGDMIVEGMKVYMSEGTGEALELEGYIPIADREQFEIGTLGIVPFAVFHDAAEPLGFLIQSRVDGDTLAFATDTVNLAYRFPGLDILAIEANYDKNILERSEKLPEKIKKRIGNAHMEIRTLCAYLQSLDLSRCREIHLLHLSDAMSREYEFIHRVKEVIPYGIEVTAARRE